MADISITATAVVTVSGGTVDGVAGAPGIGAGTFCYKSSDGLYYPADCDAVAVADDSESDNVVGIALCSSAEGQPIKIQTSGSVTINDVLTAGTVLYLSNNAGKTTATYVDIDSTDGLTTLGVPASGTVISLDINRTLIQKP